MFKHTKKLLFLSQKGFSLIEIMVALALVALILVIIPIGGDTDARKDLEQSIYDIDRAIKFSADEAILRNKIVRLRFELDKSPVEYSVEYSTSADLILEESVDLEKLSLSEREEYQEKQNKINAKFQKVNEFAEENKLIPQNAQLYGLANTYQDYIQTTGDVSLYFYPTGDKDEAIIFFATNLELASLIVPAFENENTEEYFTFTEYELENIDQTLENKTEEIYQQWIKN